MSEQTPPRMSEIVGYWSDDENDAFHTRCVPDGQCGRDPDEIEIDRDQAHQLNLYCDVCGESIAYG